MGKRKAVFITLIIVLGVAIGYFIYLPKDINTVIERRKYPFAAGEILAAQQIEAGITSVIYTDRDRQEVLHNAVIKKNGIFYSVIETQGSLNLEMPTELKSGDLRMTLWLSRYDEKDFEKYVVMAAARDEDVAAVSCRGQELLPLNSNGYRLFYGFGTGEQAICEPYDKAGNPLEMYKE